MLIHVIFAARLARGDKARLRQRIVGREKPDLAGYMIAGRNGNPFFRTGEANAHAKTLVMLMEQFNILFAGIAEPVQPHIVGPPIFVGEAIEKTLVRSEEHTSELQSIMRLSSAVFCLK